MDESEENVFLLNSGAKSFHVPSCGILAGFLLAPGVREFWQERHWSIIDNDVREAVVEISEHQFVAAAALGNLSVPAGKTGSCPVWSKHPVLHQRGQKSCCIGPGCWGHGYGCVRHGWREDRRPLVIPGMSWHHVELSFFSRLRGGSRDNVLGQWTCSMCFAERCWPVRVKCYRCGAPRQADSVPFNDKKGKGPKGPLGRAPPKGPSSVPPTTSSRPHVVLPPPLPRGCQKEESLKKQVQMHLEQVKKHEHNLEQQKNDACGCAITIGVCEP